MRTQAPIGFFFLVCSALAMWGCGEKNAGPAVSDILGTWQATKDEYVSHAAPHTAVDLVANGGTAVLVLRADSTLVLTETPAVGLPMVLNGTWELTTDLMRVHPQGMSWYWVWDVAFSGNTLTLTGADKDYDCDGDGTSEAADWNLALTR
jgi:hypothetical protein